MGTLYGEDLACIQAAGFGGLAQRAAPEIVRLLRSAAIPIRRVVDLGCGAGVLAQALAGAGFEVTGVDQSHGLLTIAAARVPHTQFLNASIYDLDLPACDAIVAIGEPLSYHNEEADADALVRNLFPRAAAVLPSGGMMIFDVIETGGPPLAGRSWSSGADWAVLAETTEDQATSRLTRRIETFRQAGGLYRRGWEVHHVRLFDANELASVLGACGFAVTTAQAYEIERLAPRRLVFFCRRG